MQNIELSLLMGSCDCMTRGRGRLLSAEVNFIPFQHGTPCWHEPSIDGLGLIFIMNVIYPPESVADSSIQWGAIGEYFSSESSYNKIIPFHPVVHTHRDMWSKVRVL